MLPLRRPPLRQRYPLPLSFAKPFVAVRSLQGTVRPSSTYQTPAAPHGKFGNRRALHGCAAAGCPVGLPHEVLLRRSEEHTSELQSRGHLVCRLLLEKKNRQRMTN